MSHRLDRGKRLTIYGHFLSGIVVTFLEQQETMKVYITNKVSKFNQRRKWYLVVSKPPLRKWFEHVCYQQKKDPHLKVSFFLFNLVCFVVYKCDWVWRWWDWANVRFVAFKRTQRRLRSLIKLLNSHFLLIKSWNYN